MESLQDKAYNAIYTKIMNLDLYPGQQVSDKQFEEEIGVSGPLLEKPCSVCGGTTCCTRFPKAALTSLELT